MRIGKCHTILLVQNHESQDEGLGLCVQETLGWVRGLAISGLQSPESRLEGAKLLNRCIVQGMRLGVAPPPQFLGYVLQTLQNLLDPQVTPHLHPSPPPYLPPTNKLLDIH